MIHIWHEDSANSSTDQLWKLIITNTDKRYNIEVRAFNGNAILRKEIENNIEYIQQSKDVFIIFMDCVQDNTKAFLEWIEVKHKLDGIKNAYLSDVMCIEWLLLSFKELYEWTCPLDDRSIKYNETYALVQKFLQLGYKWAVDKELREFIKTRCKKPLTAVSCEEVAYILISSLLNGLRQRFIVSKKVLGRCWTCSCCEFKELSDTCRIRKMSMSSDIKAYKLYRESCIIREINRAGLKFENGGVEILEGNK